jgi:hypothetical protein
MNKLIPSAANGAFKVKDFNAAARDVEGYLQEFIAKTPSKQKEALRMMRQQHAVNDIVLNLSEEILAGNARVLRVLTRARRTKCLQVVIKIMLAGAPRTTVGACMSTAGDQLLAWTKGVNDILVQRLKRKAGSYPQLLTSKDCNDVLNSLSGLQSHEYSEYSEYLRTVYREYGECTD